MLTTRKPFRASAKTTASDGQSRRCLCGSQWIAFCKFFTNLWVPARSRTEITEDLFVAVKIQFSLLGDIISIYRELCRPFTLTIILLSTCKVISERNWFWNSNTDPTNGIRL